MKKVKILSAVLCFTFLLGGCSSNGQASKPTKNKSSMNKQMNSKSKSMKSMSSMKNMSAMGKKLTVSEGKGYPVTIKDIMGNEVTLKEKPKKIAAISGTFLGLLYSVGGTSICTSDISGGSPAPKGCEKLPNIGKVYNPDVEKIIALKPDLVIAQFGLQNKIIPALKQSKIPVISFNMRTYDDVIDHLKVMGRITGNVDKADNAIKKMENKKSEILSKLPKKSKKAVILYATSKDVSVKLENSIAGNAAKILKINNIASGYKAEKMGGETIPFSAETIIEKDPDVILVTSMLKSDASAKKVIEEKLGKDPIWKNLRAVKEGKIVYLPQKYFLFNPGEKFVDGLEYMAKGVYPEIYGDLNAK